MKLLHLKILVCCFFLSNYSVTAQSDSNKDNKEVKLFSDQSILPIKLSYSRKELLKETGDTIYLKTKMDYRLSNDQWKQIEVDIRARGNFRKKTCYFTPVKLKIKKANRKGTAFRDEKNLKMVLPCLKEKDNNDNVIKEYLAYKFYEVLSPYYFKTRLLDVTYIDEKKKKQEQYELKGIFIEDDKSVAKRFDGNVSKRSVYPQAQDRKTAMRNELFQFMIGNTDYSSAFQHNAKLMFIDKKFIPVPYDFDMCGLVNASYAVVSNSAKNELPIEKVTERFFLGYDRGIDLFEEVRKEFLDNRANIYKIFDDHKPYFENENTYQICRTYINDFYAIISDDAKFKKAVVDRAKKL